MKKYCNCCGKELKYENNLLIEGAVSFETEWGYFSEKDGETHAFCLCESCYDKITKTFQIPVQVSERTELV